MSSDHHSQGGMAVYAILQRGQREFVPCIPTLDWMRKGLGTTLLDLGESAAREAGFQTIELGSSVPKLPLCEACGYKACSTEEISDSNGESKTVIHMRKSL